MSAGTRVQHAYVSPKPTSVGDRGPWSGSTPNNDDKTYLDTQGKFAFLVLELLDGIIHQALQLDVVSADLAKPGTLLVNGGSQIDHRVPTAINLEAQRLNLLHPSRQCVEHVQPTLDWNQYLRFDGCRRRLGKPSEFFALESRPSYGFDRPGAPSRNSLQRLTA